MRETKLRSQLGALAILLLANLLLYTSQGLTHTLIPLRLANGFDAGIVTAGYFIGFGLGAFFGPLVIRRVGHIRAFGGLLGMVIFAVLAFPLIEGLVAWVLLRVLQGACIAAVAVVVEAWLVGAASVQDRGKVLAIYTLMVYGGIGLGPLFLTAYPDLAWRPFSIAALLLCLSAVPVLFWRTEAPPMPLHAPAGWRRMMTVSPVALAIASAAGLAGGAFTALGPIYGSDLGLDAGGVGLMMSISVLMGLLLQWPVGHLSDLYERRRVMAGITVASALFALALLLGKNLDLIWIYVLLAGFQGTLYTLYPLALAHANDRVGSNTDSSDIGSTLLLGYGIGAAVGPALSAGGALWIGAVAGFAVAAATLLAAAIFVVADVVRLKRILIVDKGAYTHLPHSTPEVFELEPRTMPDSAMAGEESEEPTASETLKSD
ncbi:MFS transporter [Marinobacteraceae bacterium S3BR75-40.1]